MTTQHRVTRQILPRLDRPFRCLRHRVWMAACDDCRTAHTEPSRSNPKSPGTAA